MLDVELSLFELICYVSYRLSGHTQFMRLNVKRLERALDVNETVSLLMKYSTVESVLMSLKYVDGLRESVEKDALIGLKERLKHEYQLQAQDDY